MANKDEKPENTGELLENNTNQGEIDSDTKILNVPLLINSPLMLSEKVDQIKVKYNEMIKLLHKNKAELQDGLNAIEGGIPDDCAACFQLLETVALKLEEIKYVDHNLKQLNKLNKQASDLLINKDQKIAELDEEIAQLKLKINDQFMCKQDEDTAHK